MAMNAVQRGLANLDRGAWLRFFVAIAGLAVALISALYSSLFKVQGNATAAAIAASIALLLSGFVGLYTVPYLARRAALEHVREAFDYDVTKEGAAYLAAALIVGVAALNTGNNLLFIIVAAMLAAIVVSGFASALVLRGLELQVGLPPHVFARTRVLGRITLRNLWRMPSFSVNVVPAKEKAKRKWKMERTIFSWPPKAEAGKQWIRWPDISVRSLELPPSADRIFTGAVYFPFVPGRSQAQSALDLSFPKRGKYVQEGVGVATRFPFSFLVKTREVPLHREIIVYPPIEQTDELLGILPMITGEFESYVRGRGHNLYLIREHIPGDPARFVDWKASAKSGGLKVREFTREDERRLRVVFDNPAPGAVSESAYERAVNLAASLAWHFAGTDTQLSFASQSFGGERTIYDFLEYLALIRPEEGASVLDGLAFGEDYNLVITARGRGSLPTQLWASSYVHFIE
jgi:uncharacterized protein (DUF58 family)